MEQLKYTTTMRAYRKGTGDGQDVHEKRDTETDQGKGSRHQPQLK